MKATATLFVLLLAATGLSAQEEDKPDYSRDKLLRLFAAAGTEERPIDDVRYHIGAVEFRAIGTRWRFNYLPIMAPLIGTRFTTTKEWPDAFSLTGTPIATSPRVWRTRRAMNAELRRIEKVTKPKATVKVKTD